MPDGVVVFADGAVRGEDAGAGGVGDRHAQPFLTVLIVAVDAALRHGV